MLAEFAKFKQNNQNNNPKAGGQFIMSFDDYQYKIANTNILDMTIDNKKEAKKKGIDDDGLSESSEEDEDEDEDDEENNEYQNKKKDQNQKLFDHEEACDIEDAQIVDVFKDVRDRLEYNLLDIEENAEQAIKKKKQKDEEDGVKKNKTDEDTKNENKFIEQGVNNMINLHDHLKDLVKKN